MRFNGATSVRMPSTVLCPEQAEPRQVYLYCNSYSYGQGFPDDSPSVDTHEKSKDMLRCENEAGVTGEKSFAVTGFLLENAALLEQLCPFLVTEDIESGESQTVVISGLLKQTLSQRKGRAVSTSTFISHQTVPRSTALPQEQHLPQSCLDSPFSQLWTPLGQLINDQMALYCPHGSSYPGPGTIKLLPRVYPGTQTPQ